MEERRLFVDWARPALHGAVAELLARYTAGAVLDLRRCTVVVPGGRAGRRLKELLVEAATERGLRLAPPRVTTIGHLPELLYAAVQAPADATLCVRAWSRALRQAGPGALGAVFTDLPAAADLRSWLGLARQLAALHRVVAGAGLTFEDVARRCSGEFLFDDGDRWRVLAQLQASYARTLADLGRADMDLARIHAANCGAVRCDADLWLVGVADMPVLVQRMIEQLPAALVTAVVHAPPDMHHAFDDVGCVSTDVWSTTPVHLDDDALYLAQGPSDQADAVVATLAGLPAGFAADDIVVGVPDPEVVPYITERLGEAGVAARDAEGVKLERTGPYRLLDAMAQVLDGDHTDAWAALCRHPDLEEWITACAGSIDHSGAPVLRGREWIEHLDAYAHRHVPARLGRSLPGSRSAGVGALLHALREPVMLGVMRGRRPLGEWMPAVMDVLLQVYGARPLNREDPHQRRLVAACTKLKDAAAALHAVPATADDECDAATAIRVLLDDVRGTSVPADASDAAVELLGWLELHLDDAPAAIVTGVNEPFLPASVTADAFLPDSLRTALGLDDSRRRYARDAYQLTAIMHSRSHVRLVSGRRAASGDPLRPSRLLLAEAGPALARRIARFYGEDAAPEPAVVDAAAAQGRGGTGVGGTAGAEAGPAALPRRSGFVLPPHRMLQADQPIERLRVTAFRGILNDPYMFALEYVLGLDDVDDTGRELDPMLFGSLAHRVLEEFGRSDHAHVADAGTISHALDTILDDVFAREYGRNVRPAARLQVALLRRRLAAFARWHAGWVAAGWRIVAVECVTLGGRRSVRRGRHAVPHNGQDRPHRPQRAHGRVGRVRLQDR
jgi:ATP-dependent helicase/nuclease subunit B